MTDTITIAIAEDQGLVRQGFVRMLNDYSHIKILFESANGQELLDSLRDFRPAIILLDINMPVISGIPAMKKIKQRFPTIKIIVISAYSDQTSIIEYVKFGANAFLDKNCKVELLVEVIDAVYHHGWYFSDEINKKLHDLNIFPEQYSSERSLTGREILLLQLINDNRHPEDIARLLGIKERTIAVHKHRMFQKTNCENVDALILYAKKHQLI